MTLPSDHLHDAPLTKFGNKNIDYKKVHNMYSAIVVQCTEKLQVVEKYMLKSGNVKTINNEN